MLDKQALQALNGRPDALESRNAYQGTAKMTTDATVKPVLRWAGSKRQILPKLTGLAPQVSGRYIEPFCGSACLFLALNPSRALLGDVNPHLVAAYSALKEAPDAVAYRLGEWQADKETYLRLRALPTGADAAFDAAKFLYLNRYCFNGVYRENRQGQFNVPYGGYRTGPLPGVIELRQFSARLRGAELYCGDFAHAVQGAGPNDFIYLDPPYYYGSVRNRGEYGWNAFSDADVERLIEEVRAADGRGVKILISYNQAHTLRKALPGWHLTYAPVRRSVAGFSKGRKSVREYQLRNYE
ncbi:Dam family site-specific DNA-(adenine-N6)-methyltransferase [Caballeronia novacaledonica]|uniref:DNA adenine methylase n=1 Tax=Caballeronia novacaledonica TaxID=1544861 RepID=UPI001EE1A2EC|nr:Dam family site-specific DNA-(adenine-N6)-methyltransferase [Caballeronia novacaledonica]GJH14442.1 Dam family site-specific DNA-(adenine-N6)-methyltransferase [Caballeronia novacaledonica]